MGIRFILFFVTLTLMSCESNKDTSVEQEPKDIIETTIEKYPNGSSKIIHEFTKSDEKLQLYGLKELYPSGSIKITGKYNDQKERKGLWEAFFENGKKWSEGFYINGVETGEKKVWYENGKIRYQGEMEYGKPIGTWLFWDDSGVKSTKTYP